MNFTQLIYKPFHPKIKLYGMITGGFVVGYSLFSPLKHYRLKHPLGLQYVRDESGRVHPTITEWVWGSDTNKPVLIEKAKVATLSHINDQMKDLYLRFNVQLAATRVYHKLMVAQQNGSQFNDQEPVVSERFPGEVNLTDEEQIQRALMFKEFTKPTLH